MDDYKKDIIMVYHVPVDNMTRRDAEHLLEEMKYNFSTGDFYREFFIPKRDNVTKVDIEIINLRGQKTENIRLKFEELEDTMMKYFEKDKWLRKKKLERVLKNKSKKI